MLSSSNDLVNKTLDLGPVTNVYVTKFLTVTSLSFEKLSKISMIARRHKKDVLYPLCETLHCAFNSMFRELIPCEVYINMKM